MNKFWFFFYGLPNIIGLGLLLIGLLLFLGLMVIFSINVSLLLALSMCLVYLAGWLIGWWLQDTDADLHFENTLTVEEIEGELKQLLKRVQGRIPPKAYQRVVNIANSVHSVLPQLVDSGVANQDLYTVKKTVFDYLPSTLESYLRLPKAYANMHTMSNGKTAKVLLIEQLTIIDEGLNQITHNIFNDDMQALMANQRFLQQRLEGSTDFI